TFHDMKNTLSQGKSWAGIFTNRKKDRSLWHSSISITPFTVDSTLYYVGIFRELEQLKHGQYLPENRINAFQAAMFRLLAISSEIRDPGIEGHLLRVQELSTGLMGWHHQRHG